MISVVIPLYNKASQIASTLRSVLAQTYQDFEIVVVDDGSTDNSLAEVGKVGDSRIRIIHQPNAGVSAARNKGISAAKGEFIALLDGDDHWEETYLETQLQLAHSYPDCDVFATNYKLVDEVGNVQSTVLRRLRIEGESGVLDNYFEVASHSSPPICSISVMVRRGVFESVGGFPIGIRSGEDLLTWARLACRYKIAFAINPLAWYYVPTTGPTGKVPGDLKSIHDTVGIELDKLLKEFPNSGVKEYIAFWYKMRARINIGRYNRWATVKCACKSLKYSIKQIKPWVFILMAVFPSPVIKKIL